MHINIDRHRMLLNTQTNTNTHSHIHNDIRYLIAMVSKPTPTSQNKSSLILLISGVSGGSYIV